MLTLQVHVKFPSSFSFLYCIIHYIILYNRAMGDRGNLKFAKDSDENWSNYYSDFLHVEKISFILLSMRVEMQKCKPCILS